MEHESFQTLRWLGGYEYTAFDTFRIYAGGKLFFVDIRIVANPPMNPTGIPSCIRSDSRIRAIFIKLMILLHVFLAESKDPIHVSTQRLHVKSAIQLPAQLSAVAAAA